MGAQAGRYDWAPGQLPAVYEILMLSVPGLPAPGGHTVMKSKRSQRQRNMDTSNPRRGRRFEVRLEHVIDLDVLPRIRNEHRYWRVYDRDTEANVGDRYQERETAERKASQLNKAHK